MLMKEARQMTTVCAVVKCHVKVYDLCCHCLTRKDREGSAALSMTADSQWRTRDSEGFCHNPQPHPKEAT